jgi:hypothetical protein
VEVGVKRIGGGGGGGDDDKDEGQPKKDNRHF